MVPAPKLQDLSANGCGPSGFQVTDEFGLHQCCNLHDVCYGICGTSYSLCEDTFGECLRMQCAKGSNPDDCQTRTSIYSNMTGEFGQAYFSTSQAGACECLSKKKAKKRHHAYLLGMYSKYKPECATEETVKKMLMQYEGNEGTLYLDFVRQFGSQFVRFDNIPSEIFQDDLMALPRVDCAGQR